ncbi:1-acyl-sn-glycerol-3-phosphate acyltransferase [Planctomycetales bacterium]|nr:1-acyl-sn-glycerol-3-phosphate acyltransferase [Planctomycetales bacterium]GHT01731.1 1-acyl-sn-glycerol-3-phosphate acyltransferase [Planctomycetales bacterium]GHT07007.1 1-acyl-sn-glycerol-3-phosphate acyltransferase [Planctomycetales bacterium]GHV19614.1 1-acyl-sn-glycerol-3-phosphate acyltransferase [Planctomycetales bacterium]
MFKSLSLATCGCYLASRAVVRAVVGKEHLPATGQAGVVVCNHNSLMDGALLCAELIMKTRTPPHPLVIADPFAHPLLGWFLRTAQAIPLDRKNAPAALQLALGYLRRGEIATIFPEGHLNQGRHLRLARPGAAWLALESGAPVFPCGLRGTATVFPLDARPRCARVVELHCGEPVATAELSRRYHGANRAERLALCQELSRTMMRRIADLCGIPPHRKNN